MKKLLPIILGTTVAISSCNFGYNPKNELFEKIYSNVAEKVMQIERECTSIILNRYRLHN